MKSLISKLNDLIEFRVFQPSDKDKQTPRQLPFKEGQILDYVEQEHHAKRAGKHTDVRIGNRRGMLSWATKKPLPEPGGKIQLHPQPVHPQSYNDFEGEIRSGYGAGTVRKIHKGSALVTRADSGQTNYTVASKRGSNRFSLLNTKLGHLLVREKPPEAPVAEKPKFKNVRHEQARSVLKSLPPGSSVQPKIDGALVYVTSQGGRPEVFSHRKSAKTGDHIVHTERFFRGRPRSSSHPTVLAELYGERKGKAIEPQELGGVLNAHIAESLKRQNERGIKLKAAAFDLADQKDPYQSRLAKVREIVKQYSGKLIVPEDVPPEQGHELFRKIRSGKHPLTKEGVIIRRPDDRPIKIKNMTEANVKIAGVFPGKGKYSNISGGFTYSDKSGKLIGKVGTGLSDETRKELHKYVGRTARIRHQGKYESGAYRAPSLVAIDENR